MKVSGGTHPTVKKTTIPAEKIRKSHGEAGVEDCVGSEEQVLHIQGALRIQDVNNKADTRI